MSTRVYVSRSQVLVSFNWNPTTGINLALIPKKKSSKASCDNKVWPLNSEKRELYEKGLISDIESAFTILSHIRLFSQSFIDAFIRSLILLFVILFVHSCALFLSYFLSLYFLLSLFLSFSLSFFLFPFFQGYKKSYPEDTKIWVSKSESLHDISVSNFKPKHISFSYLFCIYETEDITSRFERYSLTREIFFDVPGNWNFISLSDHVIFIIHLRISTYINIPMQ